MKNILYTIAIIAICLCIGKLINYVIGGLPASLYGMVIYSLLLQIGLCNADKVHSANQWGIKHMGICFIPAAVGVINHFELFKHHGYAIVAIILFTTFLLITITGIFAEKYLTTKSNTSLPS